MATDFSSGARPALERAARLPLAEGGKVTVLHVLSERVPKHARVDAEALARRELEHAVKSLKKAIPALGARDITVSSQLSHGQPYVEIIRHARSAAAEIIVVGRHGRRAVREMLIGSTAERVIRAGDLPVLVVSRKASSYKRPVLAVDLEDTSRSIIDIASRVLGPEVRSGTMLHAYQVPFEGFMAPGASRSDMTEIRKEYRQTAISGIAKLQASVTALGIDWHTVIVRGDPRAAIVAEASARRADLLAIGTHGRTGLAHALIGSVAEWVIQTAACDVLVARPARVRR